MLRSLIRYRRFIGTVLLAACHSAVEPPLPPNAQAMTAPAVYTTWWAMTEACSGLTGQLSAVRWYQVPAAKTLPYHGLDNVVGYWSAASNSIVLAGQAALDGPSVRHEMLHALLQSPVHPRGDFVIRCAGVVECIEQCITDGGPPPSGDPSAPLISPNDLVVAVDVAPNSPSAGTNDGFFAVTVSATNPLDTPARVSLPDSSRSSLGTTFSYFIQGPFGGRSDVVRPTDISAVTFAPHERKIQVFDFRVGFDTAQGMFQPGAYHVMGRFGSPTTPWVSKSFTLQP